MAAGEAAQRWDLLLGGRRHRVEVEGSVTRTARWYVDDELVTSKKSSDDSLQLEAQPDGGDVVTVRFSSLGRTKRVTLFHDEDDVPARAWAVVGLRGIDFDPEPGSSAARREQRIREHPWRHTALVTAGGVAKVVVPVVVGLLAVRFAISLPWPDIPWPDIDLPRIPWPDIPWPDIDLPDWQLPAWVRWTLDKAKYVLPVLLAFFAAKAEVTRRRKQDALKAELRDRGDSRGAWAGDDRPERADAADGRADGQTDGPADGQADSQADG